MLGHSMICSASDPRLPRLVVDGRKLSEMVTLISRLAQLLVLAP